MRGEGQGMGKGNPGNMDKRSIRNFNSEKYGMVVCPDCKGIGYVQNPKRQCCPKCGGFGFIKKEKEEESDSLAFFTSSDDLEERWLREGKRLGTFLHLIELYRLPDSSMA